MPPRVSGLVSVSIIGGDWDGSAVPYITPPRRRPGPNWEGRCEEGQSVLSDVPNWARAFAGVVRFVEVFDTFLPPPLKGREQWGRHFR